MHFTLRVSVFLLFMSIPGQAIAGWELAWIDRFDGNGVNWDKWTAQTQANYNNEVQCYTDDDSSQRRNYEVSDGTLKIIARKGDIVCQGLNGEVRPWSSGRLNSKDKGEFLYGRVEARLRFLELKGGTWPAFWMLENRIAEQPIKGDNDNVPWPNPGAGEIDVWEWYANNGDRYITNFFNAASCGGERRINYPGGAPDVMSFNTYAIEWDADNISFFMNDTVVAEHDLSACPQYEEPMFVLLNVAIGGNLGGQIAPDLDTATLEVDYVAYCTPTDANNWQGCNESTPLMQDDDGDGVSNTLDQCPNTSSGVTVDANGCELVTEPAQAADSPTIDAEYVISLFSDHYDNIEDINYNPNWGQATRVSEWQIDGNNILKYENFNYQGTGFENNPQDVSGMDYLHLDYWTHNANALDVFIVSPGPLENAFSVEVEQQAWTSVRIPLTHYTVPDLKDIFQLKLVGNGALFLDNIYFSSEPPPSDPPPSDPPPTPTPTPAPTPEPPQSEGGGGSLTQWGLLLLLGSALFRRVIHSMR
ncbi:glycoside hydrolase family 16 protein [Alteromonas sediminis]|uniref:Glycoside hydrolase family 16 protein n=1 Tax=Alteromonas sediminis TaxID=2259342 RepID=A0A3N5YAG3_9ALTE|nr:glycoside hydrolase family 16 protein [Alteromonas sediminis]RPJ68539.1 glycoside hydrolase family 16 protein [Alteromonas sediminis]